MMSKFLSLSFINLRLEMIIFCPCLTSQDVMTFAAYLGSPPRTAGTNISVLCFQGLSFASGAEIVNSKGFRYQMSNTNEPGGPG